MYGKDVEEIILWYKLIDLWEKGLSPHGVRSDHRDNLEEPPENIFPPKRG